MHDCDPNPDNHQLLRIADFKWLEREYKADFRFAKDICRRLRVVI